METPVQRGADPMGTGQNRYSMSRHCRNQRKEAEREGLEEVPWQSLAEHRALWAQRPKQLKRQ